MRDETTNPYESPAAPVPPGIAKVPAARRQLFGTLTSSLLVLIGTGFALLLNGQVFTNSLVFLGCCAASLAIWLSKPKPRGTGTLFVILLHVALIGLAILCLPGNYQWQKNFNRKRTEPRHRTQQMGQPALLLPPGGGVRRE
jgi:hypothetical protein